MDAYPSFTSVKRKYCQDIYLNTSTQITENIPLSPPQSSPTMTQVVASPVSTPSDSPFAPINSSALAQVLESSASTTRTTTTAKLNENSVSNNAFTGVPNNVFQYTSAANKKMSDNLIIQQQQRLLIQQQQQLVQQQDEISKSLKMFAMLTACKPGNENLAVQPSSPPVDAIMQDFACNGFPSDESNRYPVYHSAMKYSNPLNAAVFKNTSNIPNNYLYSNGYLPNQNLDSNLNDMRNNFWKILPPSVQQQIKSTVSKTTTTTTNNHNDCNFVGINKKPQKRNNKNDKYGSRHCVFCENNNEAEAVVKSHSVRDTFGRVLCPKLRTYICPICKASGDAAHTIKYCPQKPIVTMEDAVKAETYRLAKSHFFTQQMKI